MLSDLATTCSAELQLRQLAARTEASRLHTQALLDAQTATVTYLEVTGLHPLEQSAFRSFSVRAEVPSATAIRTAKPIFLASMREFAQQFPATADAAAATGNSFAYLPLLAGGRAIGSLALTWGDERQLSTVDRELLMAFARHAAQALERAVLLNERHETAWTLQQALLPQLPLIDGYELAGRYRPARRTNAVGGDWYDAVQLTDGSVVGDVEGHDTAAAAAMGQLRATLRALAIAAPQEPSATLGELDRVTRSLAHARLATALLGSLSEDGGTTVFTWSNAGHPPPPHRLLGPKHGPGTPQQLVVDETPTTDLAALLDAVAAGGTTEAGRDAEAGDHDDTVVFAIRRTPLSDRLS